jgi:hypothetical protein
MQSVSPKNTLKDFRQSIRMAKVPREIIIGVIVGGIALCGSYIGVKLAAPNAPVSQSVQENHKEYALADGRAAFLDLDGNSTQELVYFPNRGPPAIFAQVGNDYSVENPISDALYQGAMKFSGILASDGDAQTKRALLEQLERESSKSLQPLIAYAAFQDPSLTIVQNNRLFSASAATSLLAELYQASNITDLILNKPRVAATAGLLLVGTKLLEQVRFVYTAPPSYAQWTKSGPGWEDIGTVDNSGMVKVSPGTWVSIRNKEALKAYEDLTKDPNVVYTSSGFIRLEHPIGESREDYYTRTERESTQRNLAGTQRKQLEQSVQQWSDQAQQLGKDVNKQVDEWNKKMQEMFKQKK